MFSYDRFSWIYKAKFWTVEGGIKHWHNPKTNKVEVFNEANGHVGAEPHEEVDQEEHAKKLWEEMGTDSPFFKRWFGDSKVVDSNGKPLPVFHGSRAKGGLQEFQVSSQSINSTTFGDVATERSGVFFSDNKDFSLSYGKNITQGYLRILNPLKITRDSILDFAETLDTHGKDRELRITATHAVRQPWQAFEGELGKRFVAWAKDQGYDGAMFYESTEDESGKELEGTTWVAFDPKHIKSVRNKGIFNPDSPNINE